MTETHADIELCILSQPRYLCVVRAAVEATAQRLGFTDEVCGKMALAIDEAVTNVIRHGYHEKPDCPIWVKLTPIEDDGRSGMQVVIEDECGKVDLDRIRSRALEDVRPGGLGVHIVKDVMDSAAFEHRENNAGLRLTMRKYR